MNKSGYDKPTFPGPYPQAHTIVGKPGQMPPDGTVQPDAEAELRCGSRWLADHAIGCSYPAGHDFGPYTDHLGEGLFPSFTLNFENSIPFSAGGVHPHTGLMLFALALNLRPDVIIETGTFFGYSTMFLAKACELWQQGKVYTLDPEDKLIAAEIAANPYVQCIKARSVEALETICRELGQVDLAFLDSWKRLSLWELTVIDPYVPEGGIVVFHDTQHFNSGLTFYDIAEEHFPQYQCILFAGTPRIDNLHAFYGNADGRGLYVMRKKERDPFLHVADAETALFGACQVAPRMVLSYVPITLTQQAVKLRAALVISMYDETDNVTDNLQRVGDRFAHVVVVQSDETPNPAIAAILEKHRSGHYILLPNLCPTAEGDKAERFDFVNRSVARNFSVAFSKVRDLVANDADVGYVIATYGDTALDNLRGVEQIIVRMGDAEIAVSRAMGQDLHKSEYTWEEMADASLPKGGRFQDESNRDFMPHLFIVRASAIHRFCEIPLTNRWCFEQCLGDASGDAELFVFARQAYPFLEGVRYNVPSPSNWKHRPTGNELCVSISPT